ncbi:hypothetical protein Tco_1100085, partial [Tanacetum coccineum]
MGSEAVEVPALKEEEFAQITMLGVHISFPNGIALSFELRQVPIVFPECAPVFYAEARKFTLE